MRYLSELADNERIAELHDKSFIFGTDVCCTALTEGDGEKRVNLLALGDVGGTVLMGLRIMGSGVISHIGIYDLNEKLLRRYEREINQIWFPDGRSMPQVRILQESELFDCDMFIFCASKGVPPVGAGGDVRMAQLEANRQLISVYSKLAVDAGFKGIFAVVSDPVDPLCKAALCCGLAPWQVQGYGLGVMNGRAMYYAEKDVKFNRYIREGRAFGPHGEDLVIADSVFDYDHEKSLELTALAVNSNMETRADGFKPYIAPAISSGSISIIETLSSGCNYSSVYFGNNGQGAFLGCRNRRTECGIEIENLPLDDMLFGRIERAYRNLEKL